MYTVTCHEVKLAAMDWCKCILYPSHVAWMLQVEAQPALYSPSILQCWMDGAGGGGTGGRTPQRKAPPPPIISRQSEPHFNLPAPPPSAPNNEELTKL